MSDLEKRSDDGIVCPYCEYLYEAKNFEGYEYIEGSYDCDECGKEFDFSCYTSHSWTSTPLKEVESDRC